MVSSLDCGRHNGLVEKTPTRPCGVHKLDFADDQGSCTPIGIEYLWVPKTSSGAPTRDDVPERTWVLAKRPCGCRKPHPVHRPGTMCEKETSVLAERPTSHIR